jgi:hypothetical protein
VQNPFPWHNSNHPDLISLTAFESNDYGDLILQANLKLVTFGAPVWVLQTSLRVTEVTFTPERGKPTIQSWFGSSGGGLPGRPELKSSGRFFISSDQPSALSDHLKPLADTQ